MALIFLSFGVSEEASTEHSQVLLLMIFDLTVRREQENREFRLHRARPILLTLPDCRLAVSEAHQ